MIGAMRRPGGIFAVAVAILLAGLTPLAYASPPDPSWVRGIYDDADYDDVVVLITSAAAVAAPVLVVDIRHLPPCAGRTAQLAEGLAPASDARRRPLAAPLVRAFSPAPRAR